MSCVFWRDIATFGLALRCDRSRASVVRAEVAILGRRERPVTLPRHPTAPGAA